MNKTNFASRSVQSGFTLIELIVVIVILGILAATAIPKFTDLSADARLAKLQGARASVMTASSVAHGAWLAKGSVASQAVTMEGVSITMSATGYPTADANGIVKAAGNLTDFDTSTAGTIATDTTHTSCKVTYEDVAGTVSAAPAVASC